jgi:surface protein
MKNFNLYLSVLVFTLLLVSCSKDDKPTVLEEENQAPVISAQAFNVSEDIADDFIIGQVTATDADNDVLAYSIITNSNNLFEIISNGNLSLAMNQVLDFETSSVHEITVQVSDGTDTNEAVVTINVEDVNEAPAPVGSIPFITTWETTTADQSITIPIFPFGGFIYDYNVDWGDGTSSTNQTADATHVYATPGVYDIAITGKFPSIYFGFAAANVTEIKDIKQWGNIAWESFRSAFYLCTELGHSATDRPDFSKVTDASAMFAFATKINFDASAWEVSTITDMSSMFLGARAFTSDLSAWDVSNVTDMASMFNTCSNFNSNLNTWNVSAVTDMDQMFSGATIFNQDLDQWNVENVKKMGGMFAGTRNFNGNISTWDVSKVTDLYNMFFAAEDFNGDLSGWNVSSATDMSSMFDGAIVFNGDISTWNVSNVIDMEAMFDGAVAFNRDIGGWDVSKVTTMEAMFLGASSFNQDLNMWDVSKVTTMIQMFSEATNFNGNISGWNTSAVEDMDRMFKLASNFNGAIGAWDVSNVTEMFGLFEDALVFDQNLGAWNISSVTDMSNMLANTNLEIANYDATLKGWSELTGVPSNISLDATGLEYCTEGETARNILIGLGWNFNGDSKSLTCK